MTRSSGETLMAAFTADHLDAESRQQRRFWIALSLLGAGLFAQQFVTLSKLKRAVLARAPGEPVTSLAHKTWRLVLESWQAFTTPADLAITAVIVTAAIYLVWSEVKHHTFTELLHRADRSNRVLFGFIALA